MHNSADGMQQLCHRQCFVEQKENYLPYNFVRTPATTVQKTPYFVSA